MKRFRKLNFVIALAVFAGSGVGLIALNSGDNNNSQELLGATTESETTEASVTIPPTEETVEPVEETPVADENLQRQLNARTDDTNHGTCTDEGSVEVDIDEDSGNGVNISINTSQSATSGDVVNDGSGGSAVSGDVKVCSSNNVSVDISNQ